MRSFEQLFKCYDEAMKMLVERVYNLLDGYSKENVQKEENESTREGEKEWTFSQDDEYWRSEEVMKAIDAIEKAEKRRQERAQYDGGVAADVGGVTEHAGKESDWVAADVGGVIEENIELEANVGDGGQVTEAMEVVGDVEHATEPTHTENGELQADVGGCVGLQCWKFSNNTKHKLCGEYGENVSNVNKQEKCLYSRVFAMRFMETYKGEAEWDCGLETINEKLMQKLRIRYLNEMLTFEKNEMKEDVVKKIKSRLIAQREIKKAAKGK
ncbi:unnamed protein product [Cuscuta campestris]|uniref:Uncharacterized protein n=1 Tax=Cuscuta campestris TaxID=132261 RepID=A0A484MN63_9ASTE|nr:unnamed protein product [Cuscuta campestris]